MNFLLPLAAVAGGILLLLKAGDVLVKHAVHLAVSYRVPKTVVGAVVLGFGTSLPELLVSVTAAIDEAPGIALGNVVGSNIANIGLILGLGALMATLRVERRMVRTDLPLGVLAALFLILWVGPRLEVSRETGYVLLAGFALYLYLSLQRTRRFRALPVDEPVGQKQPWLDGLWIVVGLVGITVGARILVWGATGAARELAVSERVIGLSVVALGTSLPELAAMVAAARKNETDLAVGNIAGSNLFNLLFVLGTTAVIHPIENVETIMQRRDFPVLAIFSVLAFPLLARARRIRRIQGLLLVAAYALYIVFTWGLG